MGDNNLLVFKVKHGTKNFELHLSPQSTVGELSSLIELETQLAQQYQRIIHNGRTLNGGSADNSKELASFGIKSPAKLLILGKKPDQEDENYKVMKKWEASCESAEKQLATMQHDIEDMEKGYAPKQFMEENLPKLGKKILGLAEEMMKVLLSLDDMSFTETQKEARGKRKCIIDRIHALHRKCDLLSAKVKDLQEGKS